MDTKKPVAAAALLTAALAGFGTHAQIASPQLPTSAQPVALRRLQERPPTAPRYAMAIQGRVGAASLSTEVVCEHDGSSPTRQGQAFPAAADLCKAIAAFAHATETTVPSLAAQLAVPVTPPTPPHPAPGSPPRAQRLPPPSQRPPIAPPPASTKPPSK